MHLLNKDVQIKQELNRSVTMYKKHIWRLNWRCFSMFKLTFQWRNPSFKQCTVFHCFWDLFKRINRSSVHLNKQKTRQYFRKRQQNRNQQKESIHRLLRLFSSCFFLSFSFYISLLFFFFCFVLRFLKVVFCVVVSFWDISSWFWSSCRFPHLRATVV